MRISVIFLMQWYFAFQAGRAMEVRLALNSLVVRDGFELPIPLDAI
jgi:hypothetical protein